MTKKQLFYTTILSTSVMGSAHAAFIYHDGVSSDGGEFSASFALGNLKNAGHDSKDDLENTADGSESYATKSPPTGGFPVTITLDFNDAQELGAFYLWNHINGGGGDSNGVGAFSLTFYDVAGGAAGAGSQIGSAYSGTAVGSPTSGSFAAQEFVFASSYAGVRSVDFTITNKVSGASSGFVAVREIGFEQVPEPGSLALLGLGSLCVLRRRRHN